MQIVAAIYLTCRQPADIDLPVAANYGWDEHKRAFNLAKHRVDFAAVEDFDWDYAYVEIDDREDYGELREIAWGFIGERLHVLVFVRRNGQIWVISLRKAEPRDMKKYAEAINFD